VALFFDSVGKLDQLRPADATPSVENTKPRFASGLPPPGGTGDSAESRRTEEGEPEADDEGPVRFAFPAQDSLDERGAR
jgi:hypothetical protein